jgi:hypothetical protein
MHCPRRTPGLSTDPGPLWTNRKSSQEILHPRLVPGDGDCGRMRCVVGGPNEGPKGTWRLPSAARSIGQRGMGLKQVARFSGPRPKSAQAVTYEVQPSESDDCLRGPGSSLAVNLDEMAAVGISGTSRQGVPGDYAEG